MNKRHVFVAEDSADQRLLITYLFNKRLPQYSLIFFDEAETLLNRLSQRAGEEPLPFVILLDVNLPGISGLEILKHLRNPAAPEYEQCRHIPVIFISGSNDPLLIAKCYDAGALAFLDKPVNFDILHSTLGSIVL